MANGRQGHGGPAAASPRSHQAQQAALDRELLELEKRRLVELRGGRVNVTIEGYHELRRRFPRGRR